MAFTLPDLPYPYSARAKMQNLDLDRCQRKRSMTP